MIDLPRSSYYREGSAEQETPENIEIMRFIDKEYTDHPFYGTRQMRNVLRRKGYSINRKRVQRLMRKMGIQSIAPKPNTSKAHPQRKIYPYLLRNFDVTRADQVWCTDLTYIRILNASLHSYGDRKQGAVKYLPDKGQFFLQSGQPFLKGQPIK